MLERITDKLKSLFKPAKIEVIDQSYLHAGHFKHPDNLKETHFVVIIVADRFIDLGQVERHKLIYSSLSKEFEEGLHALSIQAFTPEEYRGQLKNEGNTGTKA